MVGLGCTLGAESHAGQPLHYPTNLMLQQWDDSRIDSETEHEPMYNIIEPCVAESTIRVVEEFHGRTACRLDVKGGVLVKWLGFVYFRFFLLSV